MCLRVELNSCQTVITKVNKRFLLKNAIHIILDDDFPENDNFGSDNDDCQEACNPPNMGPSRRKLPNINSFQTKRLLFLKNVSAFGDDDVEDAEIGSTERRGDHDLDCSRIKMFN